MPWGPRSDVGCSSTPALRLLHGSMVGSISSYLAGSSSPTPTAAAAAGSRAAAIAFAARQAATRRGGPHAARCGRRKRRRGEDDGAGGGSGIARASIICGKGTSERGGENREGGEEAEEEGIRAVEGDMRARVSGGRADRIAWVGICLYLVF
jgi:hypothetical protein